MSAPHYELVWNPDLCSGMFICRYEQDVDELIAALVATKVLLPKRPAKACTRALGQEGGDG